MGLDALSQLTMVDHLDCIHYFLNLINALYLLFYFLSATTIPCREKEKKRR